MNTSCIPNFLHSNGRTFSSTEFFIWKNLQAHPQPFGVVFRLVITSLPVRYLFFEWLVRSIARNFCILYKFMKVKFLILFGLTALLGLLSSCSSEDDALPVNPVDEQKAHVAISFTVPSTEGHLSTPHHAVVTLINEGEEVVFTDKVLLVSASDDGFASEELELDRGSYSLVKLIVYSEDDRVLLATPHNGSVRADGVANTLPLAVNAAAASAVVPASVLPVTQGADASDFGYAEGAFGVDGSNEFVPLRFKAQLTIGSVLYDNLNAVISVSCWDDEGNSWQAERTMDGLTVITVPTSYDHYKVEWQQWGSTFELALAREDLFKDEDILLSGSRTAKLLMSETEYVLRPEGYEFERKTEYSYLSDGKLDVVRHYHKKADSEETYLQMEVVYEYEGEQLRKITRIVEGNVLDEQLYHYLEDGRLKAIDLTGINGSQIAEWLYDDASGEFKGVHYSFDNGNYFVYNYIFDNGNVVKEAYAGGSISGGSTTDLSYDKFINPYRQFNITDYFLRYSSRNNVNGKLSNFSGSFPVFVPKEYSHSYSEDGYPAEREIVYQGYNNSAVSYRAKTVFSYE